MTVIGSCRGILIYIWKSIQALGDFLDSVPGSCSESELYLGHCSGSVHREQPAAFRRDVMSFSRQRAASVDSRAPESQTLVLSYDAYPLHVQLPSLTFRAKKTIYPPRWAHISPAQDVLTWASSTESMIGKARVGSAS